MDQSVTGQHGSGVPKVSRSQPNKHGRKADGGTAVPLAQLKRANRIRASAAVAVPAVKKLAKSNRNRQA